MQIDLVDTPAADAGRLAGELRDYVLDAAPDLDVEQVRTDPSTQDFGASLLLLLATPAVVGVAKGIARWIEKRQTSAVEIRCGKRSVKVDNLSNRRADELSRELLEMLDGCKDDEK